ncbi:MAG TPA: DUF2147 domain-containing protein [Devosia sp.]|nr:DUF2147 domain-containing protein [Devosia sp.]
MSLTGIFSRIFAVLSFGLALGLLPTVAQAASVEGSWLTSNGAEITVSPCADGYCGVLSWIVIPKSQAELCLSLPKEEFAPLILDYNNADKSQQTRSLLGAQMLKLKPTNDPDAYTASIYNAEDGSTHDVLVWITEGGNNFRLGGGCLGSLCAVTQDWPRVPLREVTPDFTCEGGV